MTIRYEAAPASLPAATRTPGLVLDCIDLTAFDLVIVNTSAGKDSQAMMHHLVSLATEQGVMDRLVAVHADLGRVEWKGTTDLARTQAAAYGLPLVICKRELGDLLDQVEARGMWPSSTARYCTSDQKRDQIAKVIRQLAKERGATKVLNCLGFRAEESTARAKRVRLSDDKRLSSKTRTVTTWLPIHNWLEGDVWATILDSGVAYHPAYDLGMPRLSCVFCIFAPKAALLIAGKANPELLAEYVAVEERIGHTFKLGMAIADVQAELAAGVTADAADLASAWNMG